eukprot:CAMPEP_0117595346 /NCGR_PEP_ID=MMETSP0784-20121206/73711_1 /TAXON_ID=39447 /ORGANISM="" /LENGTH=111 /DNA_ID=CAMNT_0005397517 /DNA_START=224 /DNA_END=559 /DNA_ORIENTATION=+
MSTAAFVDPFNSAVGSAAAFEPVSFVNLSSCSARNACNSDSAFSFAERSFASRSLLAFAITSSAFFSASSSCWMSSCDLLAIALGAVPCITGSSAAAGKKTQSVKPSAKMA